MADYGGIGRMYSILYVDDDQNLLTINKIFLEKTGKFSVTPLQSVKEALDRISTTHYDAILSDYQMPEMDGIEFLKCIRDRYGNLPFILFTGRGREEIAIEALNNGADFYIQKGPDMKGMLAELKHKLCCAIERRHTELALKESQQNQNDIINFLPDATFVIDIKGRIVAWNNAIEEMTGVSRQDMIGKSGYQYAVPFFGKPRPLLIDLIHESHPEIEANYRYFERRGKNLHAETVAQPINGREAIYLWLTAGPLYDLDGNLTGAIESIRDMTEIQRIRHDLIMSRKMNTCFADMMPVAVYEIDLSGILTFANKAAFEWLGVTQEDFEEKICVFDYIVPEDCNRAKEDINGVICGSKSVGREYRLLRKDKSTYPGLIYASPVKDPDSGKCTGLRGIIIDITEQKKMAKALHESEEQLELAIKAGDIGIWNITLPNENVDGVKDWFSRTLGYDADLEPFTIDYGSRVLHPDDLRQVQTVFQEHVKNRTSLFESEARVRCKDTTWKWILIRGKVIERDHSGNPVRITGTVNDITSIRNARKPV
ncbi:MAG: PAS domain S-box protein [Methanoregula sp.]|nr:PAS domain S-box protein [Methanoregula sp.]